MVNIRKPLEMSTIVIAVLVILILVQVAVAEKPNMPTLYTPSDDSEITTLTPTFTWSPFSDPDGDHQSQFHIIVFEEPGPDTKAIYPPVLDYYYSTPNSSVTPNEKDYAKGLENGKWYHWHIQVMDNNGNWSDYANDTEYSYMDFKININITPTPAPTLTPTPTSLPITSLSTPTPTVTIAPTPTFNPTTVPTITQTPTPTVTTTSTPISTPTPTPPPLLSESIIDKDMIKTLIGALTTIIVAIIGYLGYRLVLKK